MRLFGSFATLISLLLLQYVIVFGWALTVSDPRPRLVARGAIPNEVTKLWESFDFKGDVSALGGAARTFAVNILEEASQTSTEASSLILYFKANIETLVQSAKDFRESVEHIDFGHLSADLSRELDEAFHSFLTPLDKAPTHEQRKGQVGQALQQVEEVVTRVLVSAGASQDKAQEITDAIRQPIEAIIVTLGDLQELHPVLFELAIVAGSILIFEELMIPPILRLFGFGPSGPGKGSLAAAAQRFFFKGAVPKGGWFAYLQRAGMTAGKSLKVAITWVAWVASILHAGARHS